MSFGFASGIILLVSGFRMEVNTHVSAFLQVQNSE